MAAQDSGAVGAALLRAGDGQVRAATAAPEQHADRGGHQTDECGDQEPEVVATCQPPSPARPRRGAPTAMFESSCRRCCRGVGQSVKGGTPEVSVVTTRTPAIR